MIIKEMISRGGIRMSKLSRIREGRAMCKEIENLDGIKNVLGIDALLGTSIPRSMLPDQVSEALIGDRHQMILVMVHHIKI